MSPSTDSSIDMSLKHECAELGVLKRKTCTSRAHRTSIHKSRDPVAQQPFLTIEMLFLEVCLLSRHFSSRYPLPFSRCVTYFSTRYVALLVKHLALPGFIAAHVTLSPSSLKEVTLSCLVSICYPRIANLSIRISVNPSQ